MRKNKEAPHLLSMFSSQSKVDGPPSIPNNRGMVDCSRYEHNCCSQQQKKPQTLDHHNYYQGYMNIGSRAVRVVELVDSSPSMEIFTVCTSENSDPAAITLNVKDTSVPAVPRSGTKVRVFFGVTSKGVVVIAPPLVTDRVPDAGSDRTCALAVFCVVTRFWFEGSKPVNVIVTW